MWETTKTVMQIYGLNFMETRRRNMTKTNMKCKCGNIEMTKERIKQDLIDLKNGIHPDYPPVAREVIDAVVDYIIDHYIPKQHDKEDHPC